MRPASVTQSGIGNSTPLVHDYLPVPTNISLSTVVTGTVNYTLQHTFDDVFAANYNAATGHWFDSKDTSAVGATGNIFIVVDFPVRATRVKQDGGSGSVVLTALQGTSSN